MYSKEDMIKDIKNLGILPTDTVLVHTSLKSVGALENGADTLLDALCECLNEGLLLLPGHTWRDVTANNPIFDVKDSSVCVGALPEVFRKRENVYRSLHPTHSLLAFGKNAKEFIAGEENMHTPCNPKSCYNKIHEMGGKILLIGVTFACNTILHCVEEIAYVPGRITQDAENLTVFDENGNEHLVKSFRHYKANSNYFVKLEPVMLHRKELVIGKIGDSTIRICDTKPLFSTAFEMLSQDIFLFNDDKEIPTELYL